MALDMLEEYFFDIHIHLTPELTRVTDFFRNYFYFPPVIVINYYTYHRVPYFMNKNRLSV